jgi:drug/metabolite transporter (DMT)-like permease
MSSVSRLRDQPYLLLTLTSLFWAGNAVVGRAIVQMIPPVALAEIRWTLAFLLLLPFVWSTLRAEMPIIRRNIGILALLAATSIGAFNTLLYWSLQHTTAINATLMQSTGPLLIGLWSLVLFREPLTRRQLAGICISLVGILAIISEGDLRRLAHLSLNAGDVAVIAAIAIYGIYSTLLRRRPAMSGLSFATVTIGIGAAMILPFAWAEHLAGARVAPLTPGAFAAIVYVTVFPSILAVLCYNRGVQLIGANRSGPFLHLVPLFAVTLAIVFLGERPGVHHALGAVLIIGGVFIAGVSPASDSTGSQTQPDQAGTNRSR